MQRLVITGPTGWIGQALLAMLHNDAAGDGFRADEQVALFGSRAGEVRLACGTCVPVRPLADLVPDDVAGARVIHLAYLTKDKLAEVGDTEFRSRNHAIDAVLLQAMERARPESLFVASSGAAMLAEQGRDLHPYGMMKLEQEARFLQFGVAAAVPVLAGRIFNIAGPHINKLEAYAVSNFALQALAGGPIRIAATQPVFRSFLHVDDLCRLILRAVRSGHGAPRAVDLCGYEVLEMGDIAGAVAAAVAQTGGGEIAITRADMNFADRSDYVGNPQDTRVLAMQLGLTLADTASQVRDTVEWIRKYNKPEVAQMEAAAATS